ncbi:hypothetical protein NP493_395g00005 [Ridgeia piscesae]|uniref:U3 small nucleolar RNA-associated protein 6 homolog C-terminal domain-containing protein n=1 Tax=Ridgeia piscesae TaxID=27915 RepID=A0AAD9L326_RIDPI|nr:hypothetical protein NP493_395g00005 [Ridgeia piscesae]
MWTLYMKTCLVRLQTAGPSSSQTAAKCVEVFNRAIKDGCLSEEVVCDWLDVLKCRRDVAEIDRVSGMAVDKFPHSVSVWTHRLDVLILTNADHSVLMQCLDTALLTIRENDWLPLWNILFKWCLLNSADGATTEALLERGVQSGVKVCLTAKECYLEWAVQHRDITFVRQLYKRCVRGVQSGVKVCLTAKECYLEWAVQHCDITFVRQLYKRLSSSKPLSVNFFRKYLEIEQAQSTSKMKRQRRAYEDALSEYGTNNTDLWLDYIRLEMSHKNGSPENAGSIHWRALKALNEELVQTFITEYTLMQTGHL